MAMGSAAPATLSGCDSVRGLLPAVTLGVSARSASMLLNQSLVTAPGACAGLALAGAATGSFLSSKKCTEIILTVFMEVLSVNRLVATAPTAVASILAWLSE